MTKFIKFLTFCIISIFLFITPCYAQNYIGKNEDVEDEIHYNISENDRENLVKLIYHEARGESYKCKTKIASVIFNRMDSKYWGESINDVIYANGQFTPAEKLKSTVIGNDDIWSDCIDAVDQIIKNGSCFPKYILYFRSDYHFNWNGYIGYESEDNTYFGYLLKDKTKFENN